LGNDRISGLDEGTEDRSSAKEGVIPQCDLACEENVIGEGVRMAE
jgi:hypothetical protein